MLAHDMTRSVIVHQVAVQAQNIMLLYAGVLKCCLHMRQDPSLSSRCSDYHHMLWNIGWQCMHAFSGLCMYVCVTCLADRF